MPKDQIKKVEDKNNVRIEIDSFPKNQVENQVLNLLVFTEMDCGLIVFRPKLAKKKKINETPSL